jgi:hypothetical protein
MMEIRRAQCMNVYKKALFAKHDGPLYAMMTVARNFPQWRAELIKTNKPEVIEPLPNKVHILAENGSSKLALDAEAPILWAIRDSAPAFVKGAKRETFGFQIWETGPALFMDHHITKVGYTEDIPGNLGHFMDIIEGFSDNDIAQGNKTGTYFTILSGMVSGQAKALGLRPV